ncbi:urea ABC transporter permease subunit UrtB [Bordetella genomosp. 9]|uniref:Urea ABC transporter permease subunit UrtB n=1 Tax=Bordetella genomosp. 9 TaxID=1416803 RepID=A0A1W6Z386_9BORD|nr:urea ABC transporter permease subunit UrtB [Bordetella genomosp. 9]ARP87634.1 urea ABC transporter permease subunit UrtB [Bordetella genomosp. 9]ARP91604.1 urea ABC transporter permease subunit UrtB [Bordetella genomosp. 9]
MRIAPIATYLRRLLIAWLLAAPMAGALAAGLDATLLRPLGGDDTGARLQAIGELGQSSDPLAADVLAALAEERLYATSDGRVLVDTRDGALDPATGARLAMPPDASPVTINNRLRRAIDAAVAESRLHAADPALRLAAAQRLQQTSQESMLPAITQALAREKDARVRAALEIAQANLELKSPDPVVRRHAVEILGRSENSAFIPVLTAMTAPDAQGRQAEPDAGVREAAQAALRAIERHQTAIEWAGNLFYGISLGSVLLLAALGLAITFGLMGVINMAHGELLMIGAYATFLVQSAFRAWAPAWLDWYVIAALPVAFVLAALVGMALERTVIRWLYGRPLETLLATWGISLILMQLVRSLFGAQNVEVSNPGWMTGGITVMGGLVLTYNRLVIIAFSLAVLFFVWLLLNHTRLGLFVRAITQNRRMADCVGVPTGRIDMLAFGLGSGIAGLAGVALSQLGNVGPDLGRGYIVDSFMVVVLGGVGQLAGTVIAALGLGGLNKLLEPYAGAVLAKIAILVLIVLFVQKRPQGLFAPRGRSVE